MGWEESAETRLSRQQVSAAWKVVPRTIDGVGSGHLDKVGEVRLSGLHFKIQTNQALQSTDESRPAVPD